MSIGTIMPDKGLVVLPNNPIVSSSILDLVRLAGTAVATNPVIVVQDGFIISTDLPKAIRDLYLAVEAPETMKPLNQKPWYADMGRKHKRRRK